MMRACEVLFWLLLLAGLPAELNAQCGLSVGIPRLAGTTITLSAYTGLDLVAVDSIKLGNQGDGQYDAVLPVGMYVLDGAGLSLEFLSEGKPLALMVDDLEDRYAVRFVDSPENTRWTAYLAIRERYGYGKRDPETFRKLTDSLMDGASDYASALIQVDRRSCVR